jgi:hypothetical protein
MQKIVCLTACFTIALCFPAVLTAQDGEKINLFKTNPNAPKKNIESDPDDKVQRVRDSLRHAFESVGKSVEESVAERKRKYEKALCYCGGLAAIVHVFAVVAFLFRKQNKTLFVANDTCAQPVSVPLPTPKQPFCTNCGNPVPEQAVACMSCGARPTGYKKFCRQCGIALNPEQVVCTKCGAALTSDSNKGGALTNALSKTLNTFFMVCWICMAVAVSLQLMGTITLHMGISSNEDSLRTLGWALLTFFFPIAIVGTVFGCMLFYQLWKRIPADIARTTPGKAVGLGFIPLFNLYWAFIAYKGLGEDMNKALQRYGISYHVNESLALPLCILLITAYIPFGWLPFIGSYIAILISLELFTLGVFFIKSVKDGAIALLEQGGQ